MSGNSSQSKFVLFLSDEEQSRGMRHSKAGDWTFSRDTNILILTITRFKPWISIDDLYSSNQTHSIEFDVDIPKNLKPQSALLFLFTCLHEAKVGLCV